MHPEYAGRFLQTVGAAVINTTNDARTILHGVYDAILQGDFDAFGESLSEDVELNICGFSPMAGRWRR